MRFSIAIPATVSIGVGGRMFVIPIWAEATSFCRPWRRNEGDGGGSRRERSAHRAKAYLHARSKRVDEKGDSTVDNRMLTLIARGWAVIQNSKMVLQMTSLKRGELRG